MKKFIVPFEITCASLSFEIERKKVPSSKGESIRNNFDRVNVIKSAELTFRSDEN